MQPTHIFISSVQKGLAGERRAVRDVVERDQLIRRRFGSTQELTAALYANLVEHLALSGRSRLKPFDASACAEAVQDGFAPDKLDLFLARTQTRRGYGHGPGTPMGTALAHLNLLDRGAPTHAAVLLFGLQPQRFLPTSEVKCMHLHGTEVPKPIPSYQIYMGTGFELVNEALDFVMSKVARRVGTRAESTQVPVDYELPREAVVEALCYAEKACSGTLEMIARCRDAGVAAPLFRQDGGQFVQVLQQPAASAPEVTTEATTEVVPELRLHRALHGEMTRQQLQAALGLKNVEHFRKAYLQSALDAGRIEMTASDKPRSSRQKYRKVERDMDETNGT